VDISGDIGEVVSEFDLGETILATPSISRNSLYIRSDQTLWKFSAQKE